MGTSTPPDPSTAFDGPSALLTQPTSDDEGDYPEPYSFDDDEEKTPEATAEVFKCPVGSHVLCDAIKLPCGQCVCKACLPKSYRRRGIERTWPGTSDRYLGIQCPCCDTEHTEGDCWPDFLSNKALKRVQSLIATLHVTSTTGAQQLVEAFEALHIDRMTPENDPYSLIEDDEVQCKGPIDKMESILRREMDCAICHALLYQPWTTPCGHTFCRNCITRSLEISPSCPTCRSQIRLQTLDNRSSQPNEFIGRITKYFWADDLIQRREHMRLEYPYLQDGSGPSMPLFVCTVSFPCMPTLLHVFEQKYRSMMRRVWGDGHGDKHFGMVLPDRDNVTVPVGVRLRIDEFNGLPDGRSLLETTGTSRFRVKRHGVHEDGYVIAEIEDLEDVSLLEEENREAAEIMAAPPLPSDFQPTTHEDLNNMTTKELMEYAYTSITLLHQSSPNWLHARILAIYGQCPNDPGLFPWWLGSIIPADETQKVRLLEQVTVRERMKICCGWILDWTARRRSSSW